MLPRKRLCSFLFSLLALIAGSANAADEDYTPPNLLEAHEAIYPITSVAMGIVSLVADVDREGKISEVKVVNSISSLDKSSIAAAEKWKFEPARKAGEPIHSKVSISFFYDRVFSSGLFPSTKMNSSTTEDDYAPPFPITGRRGEYPLNSVGRGTVVVAVDVEEDGRVSDAKVIKSVPSLDDPSINAAKKWLFEPAKYKGKVIRSKAWIGFVYEPSLRTGFLREILHTRKGRPLAEMQLGTVFLMCRS